MRCILIRINTEQACGNNSAFSSFFLLISGPIIKINASSALRTHAHSHSPLIGISAKLFCRVIYHREMGRRCGVVALILHYNINMYIININRIETISNTATSNGTNNKSNPTKLM